MGHGHQHTSGVQHRGRLAAVLAIAITVFLVQIVVATLTGSLALFADAGHVLTDAIGVLMALIAITIGQRGGGRDARSSYGFHRAEVLAAGANGLILIGLCAVIVVGAVRRLSSPVDIDGGLVLAAGAVGLVANIVALLLLRSGARENLNVRGAYLEVLGDALGSIAVLVSAAIIVATGWSAADPIASLVIAALIVPRAISLLREVCEVLLESAPRGVDLAALRDHIVGIPGVVDVHDLHVWTITSGMPVMSAHVVVAESVDQMSEAHEVLDRLRSCLSEHFDVEHSTFQIEPLGHEDSESHVHV
ncbi:cation transporter [Aeromicrobium sp. YIM 150415]|uniref:cation diffusion facilitator family transporter n=1 Tax=Aeromicrobium sp. YIM 150415 TaxID=2803912 RepID=UPI0019625D70|nr:cation diffusion facilitator family transporter [Aeromicrobium sp. YIM 150415]MBM9462099.1 cation transporter [Aeromicrobium sp. YIM 150415]